MLVSSELEPQIAIPIALQILSDNAALSSAFVVGPGSALAPYFCTSTPRDGKAGGTFMPWPLLYQPYLADRRPLPDWIRYEALSFTLNGLAPSTDLLQVEVLIMATDVAGYSTNAADSFWITIAPGDCDSRNATAGVSTNVTVGEYIDVRVSEELLGQVALAGGTATPLGVDIGPSDGVTFNQMSRRLTGPIMSDSAFDIPINIASGRNTTLNTVLHLLPVPSLFMTSNQSLSPIITASSNTDAEWSVPLKSFLSESGVTQMSNRQVSLSARLDRPSNASLHLDQELFDLLIRHVGSDKSGRSMSIQLLGLAARNVNPQTLLLSNATAKLPPIGIVVAAFSSVSTTNSTLPRGQPHHSYRLPNAR
ncbi:hypothetical protein SIIN_745_T [Serendipita indica DSM 11827]|nr:hypothetical protein SIIN_745_T [Serendipita indica DSM 11827]